MTQPPGSQQDSLILAMDTSIPPDTTIPPLMYGLGPCKKVTGNPLLSTLRLDPHIPEVFFMGEVSGAGTPVVSYGNLTSNGSTPVVDVTGGTLVIMMDSIYDGGVTHSISPSSYSQLYTDQFITNSPAVFAGSGDVPDAAITDAAIGYGTPPVNGPYLLVTVPYSS